MEAYRAYLDAISRRLEPELRAVALFSSDIPEARAEAAALTRDEFAWRKFLAYASRHQIVAHVLAGMRATEGLRAPDAVYDELRTTAKRVAKRSLLLASEALGTTPALEAAGIRALVMKGPALSSLLHGDYGVRPMHDVDVFVAKRDVRKLDETLRAMGFEWDDYDGEFSPRQRRALMYCSDDLIYRHPKKPYLLEAHWRLFDVGEAREDGETILRESVAREQATGTTWLTPKPETELLYLLDHGAKHQWMNLKWLHDVALYPRRVSVDWEEFGGLARRADAERTAAQGLALAEALTRAPAPEFARKAVVESRVVRSAIEDAIYALKEGDKLYPMRGWSRVLYYLTRLRLRRRVSSKVGMLVRKFLFQPRDWLAVPLPDFLFFLYFPLRPVIPIYRRLLKRDADR